MEAPEKIFVTITHPLSDKYAEMIAFEHGDGIEYTRTDAFIEKACEFISLNVADYIDVTHKGGIEHLALQEKFIDCFRKYMEE